MDNKYYDLVMVVAQNGHKWNRDLQTGVGLFLQWANTPIFMQASDNLPMSDEDNKETIQ